MVQINPKQLFFGLDYCTVKKCFALTGSGLSAQLLKYLSYINMYSRQIEGVNQGSYGVHS